MSEVEEMKENKKAEVGKVIPESVIDKLIEHHEGHGIAIDYDDTDLIKIFKKIKKQAISIEKMIPVSVIDARIKEIEATYPRQHSDMCDGAVLDELNKLKKQALFVQDTVEPKK